MLLSQFLAFKLLGLLELGHWLNSSFIAFKNEYYYLLHLLVVLLQVLNIPWSWESLPVQDHQVITALSGIMDDPVGSFPGWAEFPLGKVFGCRCDFAWDEVPYFKSSELYSFVVVIGHLLLVLCHLVGGSISDFIQAVQVDP